MDEALWAVYGASGCGRGVMPLVRTQLAKRGIPHERAIFVDDAPSSVSRNGHRVMTWTQFLDEPAPVRYVALAIANSVVREKLARRCEDEGVTFWHVHADNVVMLDDVALGEGSILSPFVTLTSNIKIGRHFHANLYSYVEHDCQIGDFVTFAPGVCCNGNVLIEDHVYIGAGAIIRQGRPGKPLVIGRGAVIGMGAIVTGDVTAGMTVVGNPARPLVRT